MQFDKIFITISSANEKDLKQTISSAISNAESPKDISFGVFDICMNNNDKNNFNDFDNVFYMPMKFNGTMGVGLSRLIASSIIPPDFNYVLQIDGHMLFTKNWDLELKKYYKILESKFEKPIISSRVPDWSYDDNNKVIIDGLIIDDINNFEYKKINKTSKLIFKNYKEALIKDGYPTVEGIEFSDDDFVEHNLISAHFTFSKSDLYREILHDPRLPWGGDEPIYALRAWTRGYRMFSIKPTICFHYNKKSSLISYGKHPKDDWRHLDNNDKRLLDFYIFRYKNGQKIMKDILLGKYFGYWGSPNFKKLKEFEESCNISFKNFYSTKK